MLHSNRRKLRGLIRQLESDWSKTPSAFTFGKFVSGVMALADGSAISRAEAARAIAGAMFLRGIDDDPLRAEIVTTAGAFEASTAHTNWRHLESLIAELNFAEPSD